LDLLFLVDVVYADFLKPLFENRGEDKLFRKGNGKNLDMNLQGCVLNIPAKDFFLKTAYLFFIAVLSSGALFIQGCSGESKGSFQNGDNQLIPAVEATQARYGSLPLTERLTGVVRAKNQIEIYPEISAPITAVNFENGDFVEKGHALIRLRDNEFRERLKQARANYQIALAQVKQAEARLKEFQSELERTRSLAKKELASQAELETIQTQVVSAEADVELAKARVEQAQAITDEREETLSQTVIRAPVSGTIGNRNAEIGMLVDGSTRLFTLGQLDSVRIEVVLTDRMLNYIEKGQRAEIYTEFLPAGLVSAPLTRISPFLNPVTHSTGAHIDIANPNSRLKSGMFVTVDIYYGESEQATLVPLSALYENPSSGVTGVFVSSDTLNREPVGAGTLGSDQAVPLTDPVLFEFVPVEVLAKGRMQAGIDGVEPGKWIVTLGQDLFGADSGTARVRPVKWEWVELLQNLQRQDLLQEIMERQQKTGRDTIPS
jgi:RND family efflux transporter MFP subunit